MATKPLRAESLPANLPQNLIHVATLLSRLDRDQIGATVEVLVAFLDLSEADPDIEDDDPDDEHDGREHEEGVLCAKYGMDQTQTPIGI